MTEKQARILASIIDGLTKAHRYRALWRERMFMCAADAQKAILQAVYEPSAVATPTTASLRVTQTAAAALLLLTREREAHTLSGEARILSEAVNLSADELARAELTHPAWPSDPLHAWAIVQEEIGETYQALYTPGRVNMEPVESEATQAAAMCIRFLSNDYDWEIG